jgi:GT2 family glycosyltransferase
LHTKDVAYEVIVVDNASTKDNVDDFLIKFPKIKLIKSSINLGFAKGNNLGLKHATGDKILLLNSDTWLTEDSISIAAKYIDKVPQIGALSVRLIYPDGNIQHTARAFRSIRNELLDLFRPVLYVLPYRFRAKLMLNQYFKNDFNTFCDWVSGAFMMFRKDLLSLLPENKLDERFFMYGEDQLWCYQFSKFGYRSYFTPDSTVVHIANASTEPGKRKKLFYTRLSREKDIMQYRKGKGIYFYLFAFIYTIKACTAFVILSIMPAKN